MSRFSKTLVASAIFSTGLVFSGGAAAQAAWLANEGPIDISGDLVVDNTPKGGAAVAFGCKVKMAGEILGVNGAGMTEFRIDNFSARNNGWDPTFSLFCNSVTTEVLGVDSLPWQGTINPTTMRVAVSGVFINVVDPLLPTQPGCGPNGVLTGDWRQAVNPAAREDLRSAYSVIDYGDINSPASPIVDAGPGDCLVGGVLNVTRPTGPLVQ